MKKGDIHYVVFTNNGEILTLNTIENLFRNDVKLIIKRTFLKTSNGQRLFNYFSNEVLDENQNVVEINFFKWNKLECLINKNEYWGNYSSEIVSNSVVLRFEIKDHFGVINKYMFPMSFKNPFVQIKNTLELLDRVGTHQATIEIKKLERQIRELTFQLNQK